MNRILIMDDDRELCALIKRGVQSENIEADFCNTGKEGIEKLKDKEYQLDDYLTKPFDMDELIARIVSLIRRYTRFNQPDGTPQQLHFDGLEIGLENRSITTINGTFELPPKEFGLLLYCM